MKKELANKQILEDFVQKTILNELEYDILIRYVKNESIIQISINVNQSTSTISRTIAQLKEKYKIYKKMELAKLLILQ